MKRILIFFLILSITYAAFAHQPSNIKAEYSGDKKELNIDITHQVYDPTTHYIKKITIFKNKKEIISDHFDQQQNDSNQELQYVIRNLKKKDQITVKAICNVFGNREETIVIEE